MATHKFFKHIGEAWYSKNDPAWIKRMIGIRDLVIVTIEVDETEVSCDFELRWIKRYGEDGSTKMRFDVNPQNMALISIFAADLDKLFVSDLSTPSYLCKQLVAGGYEDRTEREAPADAPVSLIDEDTAMGALRAFSAQHADALPAWQEGESPAVFLSRIWSLYSAHTAQLREATRQRDGVYAAIRHTMDMLELIKRQFATVEQETDMGHVYGMLSLLHAMIDTYPRPVSETDDPNDPNWIPF